MPLPMPTWQGVDVPVVDTSVWDYQITWTDNKRRESGTMSVLQAALLGRTVPSAGQAVTLRFRWTDIDPNVTGAYLYRKAYGTTDHYRVYAADPSKAHLSSNPSVIAIDSDDVFWVKRNGQNDVTVMDITPETTLTGTTPAPLAGENAPPNKASLLVEYNGRLVLNDKSFGAVDATHLNGDFSDYESMNRLQFSKLGGPTQFSPLADIEDPAGAQTLVMGSDSGNPITGILPVGTMLGVWKQKSRFYIVGDDPTSWNVREVDAVGCIAPSSLQKLGHAAIWLAQDGVYAVGIEGMAFEPTKLSGEVESYLKGWAASSKLRDGRTVE